ncbi:MAG: hypothetical protein VX899_09170 [Myxococcota bacterium]|nr:hypothetical protein [Myxococcota bacterium]
MLIAFVLACTTEPPAPPAPEPVAPKPRVSMTSLAGAEVQEAVGQEGKPQAVDPGSACAIDIDLSKVPIDKDFKVDGVEGRWERTQFTPYVLRDPSGNCPILSPAKLVLVPPADLGCTKAILSVNTGCSGECSHASSSLNGQQVASWSNGLDKKVDVELAGAMDHVEFSSQGAEICRVRFE